MKRVEFHQAVINVQFRILDDDRSYGLQNAQVVVLVDSEPEWTAAIQQIRDALQQVTQQVQSADSH